MKTITTQLKSHLAETTTSVCTCWKITRTDGVLLGFTDHDVPLTIDGLTYVASSGYFRSAISNSATTAADNLTTYGFLNDDLIREDELRNGTYDYAEVEIFLTNWADLSQGILRLRYGYFGETTVRPSGLFSVELRGLTQLFSQTVGQIIQPECRADLGDKKCGIKLVPEIRAAGKGYKVGDRVLVPVDLDQSLYYLPIRNGGFEFQEFSLQGANNGWGSNKVVTSNLYDAYAGTYTARPTGSGAYFFRGLVDVRNTDLGYDPGGTDPTPSSAVYVGGATQLYLRFYWYQKLIGSTPVVGAGGPKIRVQMNFYRNGVYCGSQTRSGAECSVVDTWERKTVDIPIPSRMTHVNYYFYFEGTNTYDNLSNLLMDRLDYKKYSISGGENTHDYEPLYRRSPEAESFEPARSTSAATIADWTYGYNVTHVDRFAGDLNAEPYGGDACVAGEWNNASDIDPYDFYQNVGLDTSIVDTTKIDDGLFMMVLNYAVNAMEFGSRRRLRVNFYNVSSTLISTYDGGWADLIEREWHLIEDKIPVPPGTRSIRIRFSSTVDTLAATDYGTLMLDAVSGYFQLTDFDEEDLRLFGGVEYICTTAGTTALEPPTFDHIVTHPVTDGTVHWNCVIPQYTFIGQISAVNANNTVITVPGISITDDFFKWGVCRFMNGRNKKRAVEVLGWNNTTKLVTLALPSIWTPQVGDWVRIGAGCDHTRSQTGCLKFNNIINFRGEPDVPGTDQYFKVGGGGK